MFLSQIYVLNVLLMHANANVGGVHVGGYYRKYNLGFKLAEMLLCCIFCKLDVIEQ